ncbi:MAG: hypothetical protein U5J97_10505 [Trueperaceae bacterium]|nr:hypothetical protein [Trueperaceae bacterium]
MYTLIAHHRVKDFQVWRQAAAEGIEREKRTGERGILEAEFYQSIDGETAIFLLTFRDLKSAQAHQARLNAEESKRNLERIGVIFPVTVLIAEAR